jgi:hypothetical protein
LGGKKKISFHLYTHKRAPKNKQTIEARAHEYIALENNNHGLREFFFCKNDDNVKQIDFCSYQKMLCAYLILHLLEKRGRGGGLGGD